MQKNSFASYIVGGAVRDALLNLPLKDKDYVVVGSTPQAMLDAGYKPVGKDFPVFLHPQTHNEYALARTERKTAVGYKGFTVYAAPDVTLEQDLSRRDFTINAIAQDSDGNLIDPFNGVADIKAKTLRHVSAAFVEDPVRILRAARFAARFSDFNIAPETMTLMQQMVQNGEVDALVPERVWQELAKGLMEAQPSRMFEVLRTCGALQKILPELNKLWGERPPEIDSSVHVMLVIDYAAKQHFSLPIRFAALMHDIGKGTTPAVILPRHIGHEARNVGLLKDICKRLKVPNDCKELALMVAKLHGKLQQVSSMKAGSLVEFLTELDAFRQPARFHDFLNVCACDSHGRTGLENSELAEATLLLTALQAALTVDAGTIAKAYLAPEEIKQAVFEARLAAVQQRL